jgi:hypothetical protein
MYTVTSADGTRIAYDRHGEGPAVILVNGALGYRKFKTMEQIATALSEHCTVINYDRRGRGRQRSGGTGVGPARDRGSRWPDRRGRRPGLAVGLLVR